MLIVLLYHQVNHFSEKALFDHFLKLSSRFPIVLPGEQLSFPSIKLCLTFDDAYKDFYQRVFPILQDLKIKAVLSVPILPIETRDPNYCSWEELFILAKSPNVHIASHSYTHCDLTKTNDLQKELVESKILLEKKLKIPVKTFVYPFGKFNSCVHQKARANYPYVMRIGNALNWSWQNTNQLIYRIPSEKFSSKKLFVYSNNFFLNVLRNR